ncbi:MAG: hypothetical protein KJZ87_14010 [Thermoguttaceae bacterium]|nr:hypothetical protein [Thermoguttaceae bacterium]
MGKFGFLDLLRRVHSDEEGAVSLETVLIIGAIALPILIFLWRVAWPNIRAYFDQRVETLMDDGSGATP